MIEKLPVDLQKAVEFHGHLCPGLVMGYRVALAALRELKTERAKNEELIAIVENKSCSVDAVQYLTGCTFGKGNLFFRDFGKQVFTFVRRSDGKGIRIVIYPERLSKKSKNREEFINALLEASDDELLTIEEVDINLPREARIYPTLICSSCHEGVMEPAAVIKEGKVYCRACADKHS